MLDRKLQSWFYPEPTGDVGRDRNARTLQFTCLLFAFAIALVAVLDTIARERVELPILVMAVVALVAAAAMNRAGMSAWAARMAIVAVLLTAILLVLEARDGIRSHAMLVFPGLLLISMTLLDRKSYVTTAGIVLLAVAALGIAERHGLTGAIPGIRTPTSYDSIFYVDLTLAVFAMIGSRIASDAQRNVFDLRASVERLSSANLELTKSAEALRRSESLARARTAELQAIMDAAPAVILVANDAECHYVGGNQTAYAMMRQKPGTNLSMAAPEGERPTNRRVMQNGIEIPLNEMPLHKAAFTGQPIGNYELEVVFEDGTSIDLLGNVEPIPDENGVPRGVVAVLSDITERKQAETALRDSEERFRVIFSQAAVGMAQTSLDGKFVLLNDRLCEILGYTQAELRGKNFLEITHPDEREASLAAIRRLLAGEISSWSTEKRYVRKDDVIVWARLSVSLVRDQDNRPQYVIVVVEDVTERIQADRALRDSERRLMLAQSAAHIGIWEGDLRTNQKTISEEYAKLFGLPPDKRSLTYEEWLCLIHPNDRERLRTHIGESVERTGSWDTEYRVVWPDGSVHWLLTKGTVIFDDSGEPVRSAGVNLDITERKRAEEVRSHLAAIVESSDDAIIGKTLDGAIVSWNPSAERIYGYKAEEMVGRPISLLSPPERPDEIPQMLERLRHGERLERYETTGVRKDGRRIEVSLTISPITDGTGAVVGASAIARDITEQNRAEAALRESEERFRNMADTAPVMIWVSGPDKGFTFFNKTWLDFTGRTMEQELSNGWAEGVHPEDLDRCFATYSSSFDARSSFRREYRLRRADGEYRWVLDNGVPLYRGDQLTGYIGSCIDVTEQKLAQDRLRTSERRLIGAQRLARVGSWERHFEGEAIYWSDEMFRIFGLPVGPPLHFLTLLSSVHPDDREKIREANHKALAIKAPVIVEYRITGPDGEMRFLRSVVEVIGNDPSVHPRMAGATQDITEQVRVRELLVEGQERLTSAQRLAHVGNWVWDIKADRVYWSEELCRIFGRPPNYTPDYVSFLQAVQPQDRERVEQSIRDRLAGKKRPELEFRITRPDGEVRTVASISEVQTDGTGSPVRMTGACQDVTDQRRAEAASQKSRDEMAHLNRVAAMGELTASLAHELNQPLAAILLNSQAGSRFLSGQPPNLARVSDCLNSIAVDSGRAGEVIRRLRGLLKKGESQASLVDVNEVVSDALRLVENDTLLRQVSVNFEPLPGLPPVLGDRIQLYQVVLNLIVNGLDAVAERQPGDRWVSVRTAEADGGGIELTVEDSGEGITKGDLTRVFEPFFTTKRAGLGMGLSISRSIVEAHGGRIWAESSAGRGAIFRCVWPVAQQAAVASTL